MIVAIVGWMGALTLLTAYGLLTKGRFDGTSATYLAMNLVGAICLGISTAAAHAWPSSVTNVVWLALGIGPLVQALRERWADPQSRAGSRPSDGKVSSRVMSIDRSSQESPPGVHSGPSSERPSPRNRGGLTRIPLLRK